MRLKKLCITILIMITILFTANTVFAASVQTEITTTKQEVQAEKEEVVTLNLKLNNFQKIEDGLYAYKGQIQYNKDVFYELDTKNFKVKNNWTSLQYNKENNEFVVIKKSGVTDPEEFLQIDLKVKNNAKAGNSNIVIKNQTTSEGKEDIEINNLDINIKVIQEENIPGPDDNNNNDDGNNNDDNNNSGTGDNSGDNNSGGSGNTGNNGNSGSTNKPNGGQNGNQGSGESSTVLPQTGLGISQTIILIVIEVLLVIAIYSFIKYKKLDKKIKIKNKKIIGMFLIFAVTAQIAGSTYAVVKEIVQKGELNDDGLIDYSDVELVQKHLIGLENLPVDKLGNADLNDDKKITVTDLTLLIKKIENKRKYIVELENISTDNYYPNKNEEIEVSFIAKINYDDVSIKKVIVNNVEYNVEKLNENAYKFKLNVGDKAEKKDFKISKVILSTNEEVKIDYNFSISILKEKPYIDEKTYKLEETFKGKANISFDLVDKENSIKSAQFTVYEKTEENSAPIVEIPINAGNNKKEIPVEEGKTYIVEIKVDYNLAPEQLPGNEHLGETILYSKEFTVNLDYKFKISNVKTLKADKESTIFTKGEQIQVSFNSTNAAFEETKDNTYKPNIVTINGKEYQVTEKKGNYVVTIDGIDVLGNQNITIEKVKLGNGKEFTLEKNNSVQVKIEEKKPKVTNFETQEDIENKNIKIKFNIIDEGNTIQNAKIVIYDSKNNVIESKDLSLDEIKNGTIETTLKTKTTTKYIVQVIANYKVTDTEIAKDKVLLEKEVPATIYATIQQAEINKTEVEKNKTVNITYKIETNSKKEIEKIRVNDVNYVATKLTDGNYKITVQTGNVPQLLNLETTKVIFEDKTEIDVTNTLQVNVLKDIPTISDIKQEDTVGEHEVTISFTVNDIDNSYINGKVQLVDGDQIVEEKEIVISENKKGKVTFDNVQESVEYTAKVLFTYNRYTQTEEHIQEDALIQKIPVILIHNYQLQIDDLKTEDKEKETIYFNKKEEIILSFTSTNASDFVPENIIINGQEYMLTKSGTNKYKVALPGYDASGKQEIKIEKIILSNHVEVEPENETKIDVEILKDKPNITDFSYNEITENKDKIKVNFILNDNEQTLVSGKITITDKNKSKLKEQDLQANNNEIVFDKTDSEYYYIKVVADYNLGTDDNNLHTAQVLLDEEMEFTIRKVEMKDILDVYLYRKNGDKVEEVSSIFTHELEQKDQFLVKVEMKDLPAFYAPLKSYRVENNELKLELEYENITQYENDMKQDKLEVVYGAVENNKATNNSLSSLLSQMKKNPTGTFNLTRDYNASSFKGDHRSLVGADLTFQGIINGNGHKIYNLSKPIFDYVKGATIKDLVLENIYLSNTDGTTGRGALSNEIGENTTINNVHVKNMTITTSRMFSLYGGITGKLTGSTIKECSVTNLTITGPHNDSVKEIGGITGYINYSTIENCYVVGTLAGNTSIGGIAGTVEKYVNDTSYIRNCIAKVNIQANSGPSGSGGIIGFTRNKNQINLKRNISLATGRNAYKLYGVDVTTDMINKNYVMEESTLANNDNFNINKISKNDFNEEFYKKEAKFDTSIWNLDNCSYDKLPTLNNADPNNQKEEEKTTEYYIPDKTRLEKMTEYDKDKEILYSNLYKLMPFYDAKYLVLDGAKISNQDILNDKVIKEIISYDKSGNFVAALTKENYDNIDCIRIIFNDDTTKKYTLKFEDTYGNIANYKINELDIGYNFDKYIIKQNATIITELSNYIQNLEYEKDLQGMVSLDRGHPAYKEHFNEVIRIKKNANNFVYNYLSNVDGLSVSTENEILNTIIRNKLLNGNEFKRTLFAYNYYSRFYGINMDGAKLSDIMLFKGELYRENTKANDLVSEFWNSSWKNSHVNYQFYRDTLAPRFGISKIGDFIDYNIKVLTDYNDPNEWFTDNFKGLLVETPAKGHENEIDYRAWTQLKKRSEYVLALLTLPENAGYMISTPTVFFVGSQRVYITNPENEEQQQELLNKMQNFADQVSRFYGTAGGFIESSYFNNICDIAIDTRFLPRLGEQFNAKTNDLFHKNFNEILNEWSMIGGVGAYAGSQRIYFVVNHTLDSYSTWTHETGHNQTARLFFKNSGFRPIGGGASADGITGSEDYTDGNTSQGLGDGEVNFNLGTSYSKDKLITTNLTPERIDTTEEIESYYRKMFEAIDFLDYAEAKAFLKLTPEEQSKVAVQIYYPNAPGDYSTVGWKTLSKEDFESLKLKTIDDLWNHKITIKPGVVGNTTQTGQGDYGSEGMYIRRWYQPYNENGRTHTYGFKYTAWQMLGIGGYDGGYVTYYSGRSRDDLDAIRKVTKDSTMTWQKFKQNRYKLMQDSWNQIPYFNADDLVEDYVQALKTDAQNSDRNVTNSTNIRRINYHYLKRVTDDFRQEVLNNDNSFEEVHIKTAKEFKQKLTENPFGNYVLDNDIDLSTLTGEKAIIDGYFMGKLDGQGHKLKNNTIPIFEILRFAHVSNLNIENSEIEANSENIGSLAKKAEYSEIKSVLGKNINITSTNKQTGGLFGSMTNSYAENVHITKSTVSGDSRVGVFAGYINQTQIQESTANGKAVSKGSATGVLAGEVQNKSSIKNSYAIGEAKGSRDIGGLAGYVNESAIINCFSNAMASGNEGIASLVGQTLNDSKIKNNITLVNQLTGYKFDGRTAKNKFTNFSNNYENEGNIGTSTLTRTDIDFTGKISVAKESDVERVSFYTETLNWSDTIWDFSGVKNGELPKLKNSDPNEGMTIVLKETINSEDEFIEKLSARPDGEYTINKDLDFSNKKYEVGSVLIPGVFFGKIEGNGHTIKNLTNATIFEQFNGEVSNLNIDNFQHGVVWNKPPYEQYISTFDSDKTKNNVAAFAKKSSNAKFYNMKFNRIIVIGNNNIAVVTSNDENSTFEKINVKRALVLTARNINQGKNASTFISEKTGGSIKNCYVQGEMHSAGNDSGAIIGLSHGGITIENVVSNIIGRAYNADTAKTTGLFIGKINGKTIISNSISMGRSLNDILLNKFAMITDTSNVEFITNCYENTDGQGISNSNGTNIKEITKNELLSKEFYTNTLHLDESIWNLDNIQERIYSESSYPHSSDPTKFPTIIDFGGIK